MHEAKRTNPKPKPKPIRLAHFNQWLALVDLSLHLYCVPEKYVVPGTSSVDANYIPGTYIHTRYLPGTRRGIFIYSTSRMQKRSANAMLSVLDAVRKAEHAQARLSVCNVSRVSYYGGANVICNTCRNQNPRWTQKPCVPLCFHTILGSD